MDTTLTNELRQWLDTPRAERDVKQGASLLARLTRNRMLAWNFERAPQRFMPFAEYHLGKFLTVRIERKTHEDVERMTEEAERIIAADGAPQTLPKSRKKAAEALERTPKFQKGRRADHDRLPEEIQALWKENLALVQKKRAIHAQLLVITKAAGNGAKEYCPDGDRYPLVKEIIALDRKERENWKAYDQFKVES